MQRCFFARRVRSEANASLYENQQKYLKTDSENVTKTERRFSRSIFTTSPTRGIEKKCENARLQFRYPFLDISVGFHIDLCWPQTKRAGRKSIVAFSIFFQCEKKAPGEDGFCHSRIP